jgi:two-component system response regulator MprA
MPAAPRPSKSILLVDGELRTSRRLAALLSEDGFEVQVERDGAAAIARLSRGPLPDTLITEIGVPLADGPAIVRFARALDPGLCVIVLTRHPHLLRSSGFAGPAPVVLTKPLDYARLLELLKDGRGAERTERSSTRAPAASPRV